jgi:hypothetical protein
MISPTVSTEISVGYIDLLHTVLSASDRRQKQGKRVLSSTPNPKCNKDLVPELKMQE